MTLQPASEKLVESYESICEVAVQQNHKKLKGSGDGNLYPMAGEGYRATQLFLSYYSHVFAHKLLLMCHYSLVIKLLFTRY